MVVMAMGKTNPWSMTKWWKVTGLTPEVTFQQKPKRDEGEVCSRQKKQQVQGFGGRNNQEWRQQEAKGSSRKCS